MGSRSAVIVGFGTVGQATAELLGITDWIDQGQEVRRQDKYDYAIVCVKREELEAALTTAKRFSNHIIIRTTLSPIEADKYSQYTLWPEFNVTETSSQGCPLLVMTEDDQFRNWLLKRIDAHTTVNVANHRTVALIKVWNNYRLLQEARLAGLLYSLCKSHNINFDVVRNVVSQDTRHHDNYLGEIESDCFKLAEEIVDKELR